jgi:DNA-binding PucR family transcriptional regulator
VPLSAVLRSYRLGQEIAYERTAELAEQLPNVEQQVRALATVGTMSFRFIDSILTEISNEYESERELFVRGSYARRHTLVQDILAGRAYDLREAERTLGYRLDVAHRAVVTWTSDGRAGEEDALASTARVLARAIGGGRPLLVAHGETALTVWVTPTEVDARVLAQAASALSDGGLLAAVGEPGHGVDAFVSSKRQADLARGVAHLRAPQVVTWYRDVALAAVLLQNPTIAESFAREELGALADAARATADLRATVSGYFAAGFDQSRAARQLSMHRNTLAKHLHRAEALIGHPLTERSRELEAALLVIETFRPAGVRQETPIRT